MDDQERIRGRRKQVSGARIKIMEGAGDPKSPTPLEMRSEAATSSFVCLRHPRRGFHWSIRLRHRRRSGSCREVDLPWAALR